MWSTLPWTNLRTFAWISTQPSWVIWGRLVNCELIQVVLINFLQYWTTGFSFLVVHQAWYHVLLWRIWMEIIDEGSWRYAPRPRGHCRKHRWKTLSRYGGPYRNVDQSHWFKGRKQIYSINNIVIVDINGFFMYVDSGYAWSFHDVTCVRESRINSNWDAYFTHTNDSFRMLLGNICYVGVNHYILRHMGRGEIPLGFDIPAINAFNKMHVDYRVQVEWGIGGLKRKN